jgi:Response regulators consisting of a CheY-like receiver domain and a winged-helix DNA-binding domain
MAKEVFSKKISKAPIIILTTETSVELRKYGKEAGIQAWVIKPIQEEKFLETIDLIFQRYCKV